MIESNFSCSSSWDLEPLQDFSELTFNGFDDLERESSEEFSNISRFNESSNSLSDYDSIYFSDLDKVLPIADPFMDFLDDGNPFGLQTDWRLPPDIEHHISPIESSTTLDRGSSTKAEKSLDYLTSKLWSEMTPEEQFETMHSLSSIATRNLSLQDQIKVIKIIDPSAIISPNDKEFVLDVSCISDAKMERILELVQRHKFSLSNSSKKLKSSSKNISSTKPSQSSKLLCRPTTKTKRRQKKQKMGTDDDIRQKRKLELHGQKEMRSGLFVYEKVIKLSNPLEDEDVNILE